MLRNQNQESLAIRQTKPTNKPLSIKADNTQFLSIKTPGVDIAQSFRMEKYEDMISPYKRRLQLHNSTAIQAQDKYISTKVLKYRVTALKISMISFEQPNTSHIQLFGLQ